MAARIKTTLPIGSSQWIQNERDQAQQFHDLEVEEFSYAARNELEWLNEHMAEIFSRDQRNFADTFKTPGKLRGKTPVTARKRDPLNTRAPLTDLFAPNPQSASSPGPNNAFYNKVAQFKVAEDKEERSAHKRSSRRSPQRPGKENADSGYHGITEDEMDPDQRHPSDTQSTFAQPSFVQPVAVEPALETLEEFTRPDVRPINNDSFVSANEDLENIPGDTQEDEAVIPDADMDVDGESEADLESVLHQEQEDVAMDEDHQSEHWKPKDEEDDSEAVAANEDIDMKSPSDASTPDRPLMRKSSLAFAVLPAREPLKRSIGARNSHLDAFGGNGIAGRSTHGKSFGAVQHPEEEAKMADQEDQDPAQMHSKTSTQRLHDRITALGQSQEHRASKSIVAAPEYPVLPRSEHNGNSTISQQNSQQLIDEDDDDWIAPIKPTSRQGSGAGANVSQTQIQEEESRPSTAQSYDSVAAPSKMSPPKNLLGHQKSFSTLSLASPYKIAMETEGLHKTTSTSNTNLTTTLGNLHNTTPRGSPRKFGEGPLSASKAKLYSVLKSAKGMFASSASASAHARMDGLASPVRQRPATATDAEPDMFKMPGGLYPDLPAAPKPAERNEGRRTRSSTEHARKLNGKQDELEKARQKEAQKAHEQKEARERIDQAKAARLEAERLAAVSRADSERSATDDQQSDADAINPPTASKILPPGKLRAPGRLARPTRPASAQSKPAPVNIRVAAQSQRLGASQQPDRSDGPTPPPAATRAATTRAGSAQPSASKAGVASTARVRALEAAARKKEQDEKAAQRKAEQKRELERKRAAKAEEERRVEEERRAAEQKRVREERLAEQRRIQEARATAQKQAEQRKLDEQRLHAAQEKARAEQLTAAIEQEKQEKLRAQSHYPRADVQGTLRQLTQKEVARPALQNKSSKRALMDTDDESRPALQRGPASYQQQDNKRRKTLEEEEVGGHERHSVMAPPKRPSNMRKNTQEPFSKFPNGYAHAPPPAAHHTQGMNMYKATVTAQHQLSHAKTPMHPNDMVKLSTARIPFAESTNSSSHYVQDGAPAASSHRPAPSNAFRTPGRPANTIFNPKSTAKSAKSAKSSPMYQNGEKIELPEIATDSEDESDSDSEDGGKPAGGFRAPSWVASPALRELLTQQQLVDPESVFGPIAPLQMDEVFKGGKADRLKRFRDRGSSARWVETGDAVTTEEKNKDREMRARVVKEGGWNFQQQML